MLRQVFTYSIQIYLSDANYFLTHHINRIAFSINGGSKLYFPIRLARLIHLFSSFWVIALAFIIFVDVIGRTVLNSPLPGTKEILQNSIVCISFLQLPLAIYTGSMLRTSIFVDALPALGRKILRSVTCILGLIVFIGIIQSTYPSFIDAYSIGEYEGEGALRVPTWPVRGVVLITAVFTAFSYITMLILDWLDKLEHELEAPGAS